MERSRTTSTKLSETSKIVNELKRIFSNNSNELEKIINNIEKEKRLFEKLDTALIKYENKGKKADELTNFKRELQTIKTLIEDNVGQLRKKREIILVIEDFLSAIRQDYRIIRDYVQTLEDINLKIQSKLDNKQNEKIKIGFLISRGIEEKLPNNITDKNNDPEEILRKFYTYFIKYVIFVRETLENSLDDTAYRIKLETLQSKLLENEPIEIHDYFIKIKEKLIEDRGYSTDILLSHFSQNPLVHRCFSNNSEIFRSELIDAMQKVQLKTQDPNDKSCIQSLTRLIFKLNVNQLCELSKIMFKDKRLIDKYFKPIYDNGIEIYKKQENFGPFLQKKNTEIIDKFFNFFKLIIEIDEDTNEISKRLRDKVIDASNAESTYALLVNLYGSRIRNLDFSDDFLNVKHCFNSYFLKSLYFKEIDDTKDFKLFSNLVFYICTFDYNAQITSKTRQYSDVLHDYFKQLKNSFQTVFNDDSRPLLNDLVETLKIMINLQTIDFRFDCAKSIIDELNYKLEEIMNDNVKINVKKIVLEKFFSDKNLDKSEICLRMAQSFNIHLLTELIAKKDINSSLSSYNPNFASFISYYVEKLGKEFDAEKELTPEFSIPYYFSFKLSQDDKYNKKSKNYVEQNNQIIMSILFKVFTCSSNEDKNTFLKNKASINQEFIKIYESASHLVSFFQLTNTNIGKEQNSLFEILARKCLEFILDGFNYKNNDESLKERTEHARIIIDSFTNFNLDHLKKKESSNTDKSSENDLVSYQNDIINIFESVMKREPNHSLKQWAENATKLSDKMYFVYCYHTYSQAEFDHWFKECNLFANINFDSLTLRNKRDECKREFQKNQKAFEAINIKYLQHNQVGALSIIYEYLENESKRKENLFVKVGTGQGKSLIIAETARKIVLQGRDANNNVISSKRQQVFIITCYDHLAKRDHENYTGFYQQFGIRSMYCSSTTRLDLIDESVDVIYSDLNTYFGVLRNAASNALTESSPIRFPNYENTVLIMDEFDSLILDSDEIYQSIFKFKLTTKNRLDPLKIAEFKSLFGSRLIENFEKTFPRIFDYWYNQELNKYNNNEKRNKFVDRLGKEVNLVNSYFLEALVKEELKFSHIYLNPLVFYSKFSRVIGFSGSIVFSDINLFSSLFGEKALTFFEVPPFFGLTNLERNRIFENKPGQVVQNGDEFLRSIRDELKKRYNEQPVLIFAESDIRNGETKSDYDVINEKLIELKSSSFLKNCNLYYVRDEEDINKEIKKIGKLGSITLATRIIGRGADIKVDKNVSKGLHLLLTYYPKRENIYIQMLGRTARQDEKGSYSEIVKYEKNFDQVQKVNVNQRLRIIHNVNEYFYRNVFKKNSASFLLKWALFTELVFYIETDKLNENILQAFVDNYILKE